MNFGFVPNPLEQDWWTSKQLLAGAMERFGNEWLDLEDSLRDGRAQLWLAVTNKPVAAMVTRRDGDVMEVWLAGGDVLSGCVPFLEIAERAARSNGMTKGRITGRKGWARVLEPWGWECSGDDLVKEL